jgi:hypothetical protein
MKVNGFNYKATKTVPAKVAEGRWDVPRAFQGQMVTLEFAADDKYESGPGARFMRVTDAADKTTEYYRLVRTR